MNQSRKPSDWKCPIYSWFLPMKKRVVFPYSDVTVYQRVYLTGWHPKHHFRILPSAQPPASTGGSWSRASAMTWCWNCFPARLWIQWLHHWLHHIEQIQPPSPASFAGVAKTGHLLAVLICDYSWYVCTMLFVFSITRITHTFYSTFFSALPLELLHLFVELHCGSAGKPALVHLGGHPKFEAPPGEIYNIIIHQIWLLWRICMVVVILTCWHYIYIYIHSYIDMIWMYIYIYMIYLLIDGWWWLYSYPNL